MLDPDDVDEGLLSVADGEVKNCVWVTTTMVVPSLPVERKVVVITELDETKGVVVLDGATELVVAGAVVEAVVETGAVVDVGVGVVCVVVVEGVVCCVVDVVVDEGVVTTELDVVDEMTSEEEVDSGTAVVGVLVVVLGVAVVGVFGGSNVVVESTLTVPVLVELEDMVNCLATFHLFECLREDAMLAGRKEARSTKMKETWLLEDNTSHWLQARFSIT
jgi:hypothetical protein